MRIIAGTRKSLQLKTPKGIETRPTMDRTKETLFNILSPDIIDSTFLDLFSGSGSIGLEALSRGASYAVLVEKDKKASVCIKENIQTTRFEQQVRFLHMDYQQAVLLLQAEGRIFDIIFIDPPFDKNLEKDGLIFLSKSNILNEHTIIIIEASNRTHFDYVKEYGYEISKIKSYKTHQHIFLTFKSTIEDVKEMRKR